MSNDQENDPLDDSNDAEFEDFDTGSGSLSETIKQNPMMKGGIIIAAIAVIVGAIMLFGGGKEAPNISSVKQVAEVSQAPGTGNVSPAYVEAVKDRNEQEVEVAIRQGTSAIPVPIGPPKSLIEIDKPQTSADDPLERWRRIQEERLRKEQAQTYPPGQVPPEVEQASVDPYAEQKNNLATALATQMQAILEGIEIAEMETVSITDASYMDEKREKEARAAAEAQRVVIEQAAGALPKVEILLEVGKIEYAQLITEANTDSPGPVLAVLASGPLSGSRMIGSFSATDEYITLNFNTIVVDGIALSTSAVALDPATSKPGVITEIDRKYFQRIILPAAAAFIEGIGGAIAESGSTTVSAGEGTTTTEEEDLDARQEFFKGVEEASSKVGEILDQDGSRAKPMLRVAAGTHLGLLFIQPVERDLGNTGETVVNTQGTRSSTNR